MFPSTHFEHFADKKFFKKSNFQLRERSSCGEVSPVRQLERGDSSPGSQAS
jgi:hypothetical protein